MAQCPNCGDQLDTAIFDAMTIICASCSSTVYLHQDRLLNAGEAGVMHDAPSLVRLEDRVEVDGLDYRIVGHARFSYGPGWWDEFWMVAANGDGRWLICDEGDIAVQSKVPDTERPNATLNRVGDEVIFRRETYVLTEFDQGACVALRGVFPEQLAVGDGFSYANLTSPQGHILSRETQAAETIWFCGRWIDPFELTVIRR